MAKPTNQMRLGDEVVVVAADQLPFAGKVAHFDDKIFEVVQGTAGADGKPERRLYTHGSVRVQFIRRG